MTYQVMIEDEFGKPVAKFIELSTEAMFDLRSVARYWAKEGFGKEVKLNALEE